MSNPEKSVKARPLSQAPSAEELAALAAQASAEEGEPGIRPAKQGVSKILGKALGGPENIEGTVVTDPNRIRIPDGLLRDQSEYEDSEFDELKASLVRTGQNQEAISVRRVQGDLHHDFELLAGTRRVLAARQLKQRVFALIRRCTDEEADLIHEIENNSRKSKSAYSTALRHAHLMGTGRYATQEMMAKYLGVSQPLVSVGVRLIANAPEGFWDRVTDKGSLLWRQAEKLVVGFDNPKCREALQGDDTMTVAQALAKMRLAQQTRRSSASPPTPNNVRVEKKGRGFVLALPTSLSKEKVQVIAEMVRKHLESLAG